MLADLFRRLTQPGAARDATDDPRVALAVLFVRLARADGTYTEAERGRIARILARRFGLGPFDLAPVLGRAEALEASAPDTVRFTRILKEAIPFEERDEVMEALWDVALADGGRDAEEDGFLRLVANLLGVNDRDSGLARQRVMAERGGDAAASAG